MEEISELAKERVDLAKALIKAVERPAKAARKDKDKEKENKDASPDAPETTEPPAA